ncbi:carbohydrate ABC transporter permease [Paenibacillus sp. IB182496]|uniref:Carbohydrate ABC transporter permease n=1 Tax=Paenibacillus sabuli TaxID=2772509 RepID=A0A927BWE5_9BACL|nr:carbohydrate ABC transporter permease [Paenibacillus sabuli]MBD2846980.1 carbohydrate ABC transporter permease [Paenibacillus sabuli]
MPYHRKGLGERVSDGVIVLTMWLALAVTLYPFLYIISMSISDPVNVVNKSVWLLPKGLSGEAYVRVFANPDLWQSYGNTVFYTVAGTALNVALTIMAAYPLSIRNFIIRKPMMIFIVLTMFFTGGLVPMFILVQELGIYNTRWAILLPTAISAFNVIIARTFFQGIPEGLHESAKLDGANDAVILVRIVLPLCKPILAVLTLFYAVSHWNSFMPALLYLSDSSLQPLSLYLIKVLIQNDTNMLEGMMEQSARSLYAVQIKYAIIVVAVLPIVVIYPFLQKYFVKGVLIGSLKE